MSLFIMIQDGAPSWGTGIAMFVAISLALNGWSLSRSTFTVLSPRDFAWTGHDGKTVRWAKREIVGIDVITTTSGLASEKHLRVRLAEGKPVMIKGVGAYNIEVIGRILSSAS